MKMSQLADDLWKAFMLAQEMQHIALCPDDIKILEESIRFKYGNDWFEIKRTH